MVLKNKLIERVYAVIRCYLVFFVISSVLSLLIHIINMMIMDHFHVSSILTNTNKTLAYFKDDHIMLLLFGGLIGPFFEEIFFRLWIPLRPKQVATSVATIFLFSCIELRYLFTNFYSYWIYFALAIIFFYVTFCFLKNSLLLSRIRNAITMNYLGVISSTIFGLCHISNYTPIFFKVWYVYPILVLPHILIGYLAFQLRVKYGFFYGLLFHCLINLIALTIQYIL